MYACNAATNNSSTETNNASGTDANPKNGDLKMKINEIIAKIIMCPAVTLAKSRIINANGFVKIPIISIGTMIG